MTTLSQCIACAWEIENHTRVDETLSNVSWGVRIGVTEASIRRHRMNHGDYEPGLDDEDDVEAALNSAKAEVGPEGGSFEDVRTREPLNDWAPIFEQFDLDPEKFEIIDDTVRMSTWQQSKRLENGERDVVKLFSYRAQFRRISHEKEAEFTSVLERIRGFSFQPAEKAYAPESFILSPSDLQMGKVDMNGTSVDTIARALESFGKAAEFVREFRPAEVCIVDAGDPIENIFNTPVQLGTNDLSLDQQIELAHHVFLTGIEMLAPLVPSLRFAAVASNHGAVRIGPKQQAGHAHADYGLAIARMMKRALKLNPAAFGHVTVQVPEPHMESLAFTTSGADIGVVHGHPASGPDKIGDWWKGQALGNMPTANSRILIAGHWHSLRHYQAGDGRHVFVCPSSDNGSGWFTNLKGDSGKAGMLSFTTRDNEWDLLRVL